jgi:hypothetical protein
MSATRCAVAALALGAVVMLAATIAGAAPLDPQGEDWEGLSQLVHMARHEFGAEQVIVTQRVDLGALGREDALLMVHPTGPVDVEELGLFMRAGGRILLFDDYGEGDTLARHFGIRRVPLPGRPAEMLRGNPAFAIAEPAGPHPAVRNVSRVVTNHATGVEHPGLSALLVVHGDGEPDVLLSVAGAVGQGRLLVVGDSSVGMNEMLRYPGNRELCAGVLRYALEDDAWGKRGGKLYVLVNDFETVGTYGNDSRIGSAVAAARRTLSDGFDVLAREGMPPVAAYATAIAMGILLVAWTGSRAGKLHRQVLPRFARATPLVQQGGIAGHAARAGSRKTSRLKVILELKSALEEDLTTRLGLARTPAPDVLASRLRAAGLLDAEKAESLVRLLGTLSALEGVPGSRRRAPAERMRNAEVFALAERVNELLAAASATPVAGLAMQARDTVEQAK